VPFPKEPSSIDAFPVLDPSKKMMYFRRHWSADLQEDVVSCAEDVVQAHLYFHSSEPGANTCCAV
jgi:hypothetical protein